MKVYVCFYDYDQYEGCSAPVAVYKDEQDAINWVQAHPYFRRYEEYEVE